MAAGPYVKVVVGGNIGVADHWSCGFAFRIAGGIPAAADMNGIAHAASLLWATDFWDHATGGKAQCPDTTSWNLIRSYYYPGGSTVATVSGAFPVTNDPGAGTTNALPPQCALVASLETGLTGRHNRGRVYLPAPANTLITGRVLGSVATDWAPLIAQFLTDMNAATVGAFSFDACIGTGALPLITSVTVDDVVDTQRRRRDKQTALTVANATV